MSDSRLIFVHGNGAIVEGAIQAGCRFYAGYPITPSSEIAEEMSKRLPQVGGIYVQGEDELASINMIVGASMAGAKAMTATSGPGFSLMQEGLGLAVATETPLVIVNMMRAGPSTGIASKAWQGDIMQSRFGSHSDYEIISVYPWSVQEAFDLTIESFNLAEKYMTPVVLLGDAILARMRERLYIKQEEIIDRKRPSEPEGKYMPYKRDQSLVPVIASFGEGFHVLKDSLTHNENGYYYENPEVQAKYVRGITEKIKKNAAAIEKYESVFTEDAEVVIVAAGPMARVAHSMIIDARKRGKKWGMFRPVTIWPFPEEQLKKSVQKAIYVIVVEMSTGKLVYPVKWSINDNDRVKLVSWLSYEAPTPDELEHLCEKEVNG
ncbi:MAG: 2-oxoacid:acceptor oxidoreductase subunit alpha [Nitrososphaerota archaeon]|jgi:2-oxoglutarate ferredoxin oxidoreductase subunit alpha|nr:2-oxoacid:acceptor oxidoreductase subunit alpha [Nitrososphaerota archaeon]MDG6927643.1 2-oxoacid:acceptor oxidoreductase subunit alpha [Nitrososphaerota archaeon]MDG6931374.1 2-oxoacid:acceptor oxidoreductase subunit alpha [Nitrososphaerota archaeon]MDG6931584.1 2-oxoacid:acceptor oxidoreductase subunit alpha [Nitrososphaerota archaeon]MDG6935999.1 2-oxoacid:acceptor oxidoreductase subunit alpha [Nitrososphaerota archaeon]